MQVGDRVQVVKDSLVGDLIGKHGTIVYIAPDGKVSEIDEVDKFDNYGTN